jgi:hypothetical protein
VRSNTANVIVIAPPVATVQPVNPTIVQGQTVTLQASATGTAPFTYQWVGPNGSIAGTSPTLTTGAAGTYTVTITNPAGPSSASTTVSVITIPVITTQPASASIQRGSTHTFTVVAQGANLRYQWQQLPAGASWVDLPNGLASSYTTGTAGTYRVVVRNDAGPVISDTATLSYVTATPPVIEAQPLSASTSYGKPHTMRVKVSGSPTLEYQWYVDYAMQWQAIRGATTDTYTTNTAGRFIVEVRNSAGSVASDPAVVTMPEVPVITAVAYSCTTACFWTASVRSDLKPVTFQWYRITKQAIELIAGATSPSYSPRDPSEEYFVVVANPAGWDTSARLPYQPANW